MADPVFERPPGQPAPSSELPFPPLTKSHILHCSYHYWHPRYISITPKARLIPLTAPFLAYLRADGIVLPPDDPAGAAQGDWSDADSGVFSATDDGDGDGGGGGIDDADDDGDDADPSAAWPDIAAAIAATIAELGGSVVPKLNWSAPKDATWINATNSMECRSPGDVYLLLKSSDFVTHDLDHAFDGCVAADDGDIAIDNDNTAAQPSQPPQQPTEIPYHLVLRKTIPQLNPALEFRCFVRDRRLLALCQRDANHFGFLARLRGPLRARIQRFFDARLRDSFPDPCFAFDVYVPPPHRRVWLVDVNPWARRTDPLLFSWMELLTMPGPEAWEEEEEEDVEGEGQGRGEEEPSDGEEDGDEEDEVGDVGFVPEFRLIGRDDPEAYGFATQQYSAHKLPRDVVDASRGGEGHLREFAEKWKELERRQQNEAEASSDDD